MMIDENMVNEVNDACAVCEKPVRYGTGFAHIQHENHWVTLCCPLCMAAFQKHPASYLARMKALKASRPRNIESK